MSKKFNNLLAIGILQIGILFSSISEGFSQTSNYTWNNSTNLWSTTTAWDPTGGPQSSSSTANTNVAIFASVGASNNTVLLGSDRTAYGLIFTNGANAYTFGSVSTAKQLDIMSGIGLQNVSGQNQIFSLSVANNGTGLWTNSAGSTTTFNNGLNLTTSGSASSRTLTLGGAGTWNVASAIANGGTAAAGKVIVTATGTTTLSGNDTYGGVTTMNALGGALTLSGNNSGAAGGVTLTAGTLNLNNANALGTGLLTMGATTGSSIGSSIINNTSGGALTYLGLSGVLWSGVSPAGIQFGTSASTSANNMDFGTGLVTAATDRAMNIAGTGVTISMGTLNVTGNSAQYAFTFDGTNNTIDFDGWNLGAATDQDKAVMHQLKGSANVNMGAIVNGTPGTNGITYANSASFNSEGVTRLTGNNTYTGATEFVGSGTNIISGNNSAAVGNVKIASGTGTGKKPVVRLNSANAISSSSSLLGASSTDQIGTLEIGVASDIVLNSFGTATIEGNNMIFINSSATQRSLTFTNANNYITLSSGTAGSKRLDNQSANLNILFNGNIDIGSSSNNAVTFAGAGNFRVDGAVTNGSSTGVRGLTKTGAGTLTLAGAGNNYNGVTTVSGGTLEVGAAGALPTNSAVTVSSGAKLRFLKTSGGINLNNLTVASGGALEQNLVTITSAGAVDLTGAILTVNGTPTLAPYTLVTGTSLAGTPRLSPAIAGYSLIKEGNSLVLKAEGSGSNTAPVITAAQGFSVAENVSLATVVGTVVATDADANSTLSGWTIVSGNTAGVFAINAATGQISVAGALNYEGTPSYSLGVTVSDGTATSAEGTVVVTVTNVAEYSDVFGSSSQTADDNGDGISNLMAYALGATSPSSVVVRPALNTTDPTKLTMTASIRINDSKVSVVGEYGLTLGTWVPGSPIAGVPSSSQTGAVAGVTQSQDFSVLRGTDSKKFMHLKATQAP